MRATVLALVCSAAVALTTTADAKTVVVTADKLVDVATGKQIDRPQVVIVDGRITQVGKQGDAVPAGATRVDLPGVTLLPGLIDMHTHLTTSPLFGGYNRLLFSDSFWSVISTSHAKATLEAGFTTVRNVGSHDYHDVGLRQAIDGGFVEGPRMWTATYAIGATGGHCDSTFFPPSMAQKSPAVIDSPLAGRQMVRQLHKYGATVIKICATGGVFSHGDTPGAQQLTLDEIKAIVDEAHMTGLKVAAHAHGASGIKAAILGGVDTIEHASLVDDEGIALAKQRGAYFGMDIYNTDYTQAEGKKNGVLEENLQKDRDIALIQRQNYQKALRAGVKMIFSTDAGVYPHGANARQFATMVKWGATPLQAIQSATLTAAAALGAPGDVGQVKVGAWGDLVGVSGDPLQDVALLERPVFVMKGGDVVKRGRPADDKPAADRALTPYVEEHTHFEAAEAEGAVRAALAGLARQNAAMVLLQMPPDTFDHPGHYDAEVVLAEARKYPGKIGVLGGGGTLNAMIIQAAASGDAGPAVQKKFKDRAEEMLRAGVIGFGEMTAEHYAGVTPYQYAPADHPLYLLLADIAADHGVPIVLHMEAVPEDMAVPSGVKVPPNPPRLHANIAAFERLLAHNPRAKLIWAHAGADGTGFRTPALCRRLLQAHPNLYMEIKTDPKAQGLNYPMADGKLKPDWLALFTEFPDRFVIGSDQHYPETAEPVQRWQEVVRLFNQLPEPVRRKIGTENVARIYGKAVAPYLTGKH